LVGITFFFGHQNRDGYDIPFALCIRFTIRYWLSVMVSSGNYISN
jgi:hypothetical protein